MRTSSWRGPRGAATPSTWLARTAAYHRAAAELLGRWPTLDDPWHPDFPATIARERDAIRAALDGSDAVRAWRRARDHADRVAELLDRIRLEAAPVERLLRAWDTVALARRLHARGGPEWVRFERFLACERSSP